MSRHELRAQDLIQSSERLAVLSFVVGRHHHSIVGEIMAVLDQISADYDVPYFSRVASFEGVDTLECIVPLNEDMDDAEKLLVSFVAFIQSIPDMKKGQHLNEFMKEIFTMPGSEAIN